MQHRMTVADYRKRQQPATSPKPKRPPRYREALEQKLVVAWARNQFAAHHDRWPHLNLLHCSLNGINMTEAQSRRATEQGRLAGIPDLFLPYPRGGYAGLYIEMKAEEGGRLSSEQKGMLAELEAVGYKVCTCYGHQQAVDAIRAYYGRG